MQYVIQTTMTMAELEESLKNHPIASIYEYEDGGNADTLHKISVWLNLPAGGSYAAMLFILKELFGRVRPSSDTVRKLYDLWVAVKTSNSYRGAGKL